jgi:hypothetical protein
MFVEAVPKRQGLLICLPADEADWNGWITRGQVRLTEKLQKSRYGAMLRNVAG